MQIEVLKQPSKTKNIVNTHTLAPLLNYSNPKQKVTMSSSLDVPLVKGKVIELNSGFKALIADETHKRFAADICDEMYTSALARGTGISKRKPEYLEHKMMEGDAVIVIAPDGNWAGFSYIGAWNNNQFVSNSGLIVSPNYRQAGVAKMVKKRIFELSCEKYPNAQIFGLTTGLAVMKINSELGYEPVTYSELPQDDAFWEGCKSCVNFDILTSKGRKNCLCTAMLYNPADHVAEVKPATKVREMQVYANRAHRYAGNA